MSDEISLKEYIDKLFKDQEVYVSRRFDDQDKAFQASLQAAEKAVTKAEIASEKRFDSVNEFRAQLLDQTATFITRETYDAKHVDLQKQVDDLRLSKATLEGKASQQSVTTAFIISVIGICIGILGIILRFIK